ncbi:MAG: UDP-glucose 4-epimerase GalE [Candidatus Zhuqueibacterota bacterium]
MSLLVTGGGGYIASIVSELLIQQRFDVVTVDNFQEGNREAILPQVTLYEGDFGDTLLLKRIFSENEIKAVLHFAAETTIEFSMTDPKKYFHNNLVNSIALLDTMLEFGCTDIIFSSTAATFGEPEYVPIDENHPQNPINAYGESKLMFEKVLQWYHSSYGVRYNLFRYFNVAGASEKLGEAHKNESHLIPMIIQAVLKQRESFKLFGTDYPTKDGSCVRDYIHVEDLALAHILALKNLDACPNGEYNLGNGEGFTVKEIVETVQRITGVRVNVVETDRRAGDPAVLVAGNARAKKELGWQPKYPSIHDIVKSAWEWHRRHPHGYTS